MTEIDLIVKYLEKRGSKVEDIIYHKENFFFDADQENVIVGDRVGLGAYQTYFFGHVSITSVISGVILLTDLNNLALRFYEKLKGYDEIPFGGYVHGVNLGMSLMGNGEYNGFRRLYGLGFNQVKVEKGDFGNATFGIYVDINGYLFKMK